jgi:hypothetical protein
MKNWATEQIRRRSIRSGGSADHEQGVAMGNARVRFWIEVALAAVAAGLAILTLITREWIEVLFGVDPDQGNGALEWALVIALFVASIVLALVARWDRKKRIAPAG